MSGFAYSGIDGIKKYTTEEAIAKLEEINGYKFSEQQLDILRSKNGIKIVALAGGGKTTTIVNLVVKRIMTGEIHDVQKLLMTTYSKAGAENMTQQINSLLAKAGLGDLSVEVRTLHALYYNVLKRFSALQTIITGSQRLALIRQAVKNCKVSLEEEEIASLDSLFSYQINNMLTNEAIYKSYVFDLDIKLDEYASLSKEFSALKQKDKLMDFDDLQLMMYYYLCTSNKYDPMIEYLHNNYDYIYVDEFQDTSAIQYKILQVMIKNDENVVFIGDDDQCIYQWRGAKSDLLLNVDIDYHVDKLNLDTNYRCRDNILQFAKQGVEHMSRREFKDMKSVKDGGEVNFVYKDSNDLYDMSKYVADKIESMIRVEGVKADDICVLVRYNAHAHVLNQMLMMKGIYCNFGDDMKLSYQTIFKDVMNMVELCGDENSASYDRNACSAVLWKMVKYLNMKNSALLAEFMQNTGCSFADSISWILANVYSIGTYTGYAQVPAQTKSKIMANFKKLGSETIFSFKKINELLNTSNKNDRILGFLWLYKEGMSFLTKKKNKQRNFNCYYKFFETIAKEDGFDGLKNVMTKIKLYESSDFGTIGGNSVRISTIHGAKGLEWKHVFILAYDNISFPDVDYMVSKQDISSIDMQTYIDGERRLAYVCMTRAIDSLTIVTDAKNMSLFGLEALGGYNNRMFNGSYLDFAKFVKSHNYITPANMHLPEEYTHFIVTKEMKESKSSS